jgi:hypothetical protein
MTLGFDPTDASQRRFTGYGPAELPCARDGEVDAYVASLRSGGPPAVAAALATVTQRARDVLGAYAERMASLAVRERSTDRLVSALVALVVGGLNDGSRDALMTMPLVEHSARLLGAEPADLFEDAAAVVGHPGTVSLMRWLARKPEDRSIEAMKYVEDSDEGGFRYRHDW